MDIAGLVFGAVPIAIHLCQYLKKVKEHGEDRDQLIKKFELYIDYTKQFQEKAETGDESFRQTMKGRLQVHNTAFQNLQDLLKDPDLQSFMDRGTKAEQNDQDEGNQSDTNSTITIASATGSQGSFDTVSTQNTKPNSFKKFLGKKQLPAPKFHVQNKPAAVQSPSNSSSVSVQNIAQHLPHSPPSLAKKIIDQWMWPFRESQFIKLLNSLEEVSNILDKVILLEILEISVSTSKEVTTNRKQVEQLRDITSGTKLEIEGVGKDVIMVKGLTAAVGDKLQTAQEKKDRNAALEWLSPLTFWQAQDDAFERLHDGTGRWLLEDEKFEQWLRGEVAALLCYGMPGAGKTTLTSLVVKHLTGRIEDLNKDNGNMDRTHALAFVYYNYNDRATQTLSNILGSILRQLERVSSIEPDLVKLHQQYQEQNRKLPLTELFSRLKICIAGYGKVFIVIDALDECEPEHRRELLGSYVSDLLKKVPNVRIFATSRPLDEIREFYRLRSYPQLSIRARNEDIKLYIHSQIRRLGVTGAYLPKLVGRDDNFRTEVIENICARCEGMFLLAQLYITSLADIPTRARLREAVERLPKGLDATYISAVKRIQERSEHHWHVARRAFMWILYAAEPTALQHDALLQALATSSETGLNRDDILETGQLFTICGGLVEMIVKVDTQYPYRQFQVYQFIHYSTQEFFANNPSIFFSGTDCSQTDMAQYVTRAHTELAMTCLAYLATPLSADEVTTELPELRTERFSFLAYAALNWGKHTTQSEQSTIKNLVFPLFDKYYDADIVVAEPVETTPASYTLFHWVFAKAPAVGYCRNILGKRVPQYNEEDPRFPVVEGYKSGSALVVAAAFGLNQLLQEYFNHRPDKCTSFSQATRSYICTAAVYHDAVEILHWVERTYPEQDFNNVGLWSATPLWVAARFGRLRLVEYLLSKEGINRDQTRKIRENTQLIAAAKYGHLSVVKLLLACPDVDVNKADLSDYTPLYAAAESGQADVVQQLLEQADVDVNKPSFFGETPLHAAVLRSKGNVVQQLLERADLDVNTPDRGGWTPLNMATFMRKVHVVKQLLGRSDVDVNKPDKEGETPLYSAVRCGQAERVQQLLARIDVEVKKRRFISGTTFHSAASEAQAVMVQLLLARADVDVNKSNKYGRTPLHVAASQGQEDIVQLLLARADVDPTIRNNDGLDSLDIASRKGHQGVVELLRHRLEQLQGKE